LAVVAAAVVAAVVAGAVVATVVAGAVVAAAVVAAVVATVVAAVVAAAVVAGAVVVAAVVAAVVAGAVVAGAVVAVGSPQATSSSPNIKTARLLKSQRGLKWFFSNKVSLPFLFYSELLSFISISNRKRSWAGLQEEKEAPWFTNSF
jgi:hypothetical protein